MRRFIITSLIVGAGISFLARIDAVRADGFASLSIIPSNGTVILSSTFDASILLNTAGQSVNALDVYVLFPADKLQVVSPSGGRSIIGVWANQPTVDNTLGIIHYQGGIPNPGINTSAGVISTITFRARSAGRTVVKFDERSKVYLNDGLATEYLGSTNGALFEITLPPPEGPIVTSTTHPDQTKWYARNSVALTFSNAEDADGYSYILSDEPVDTPDDTVDATRPEATYDHIADGTHYFHVRAHRAGRWGGVTHFVLNVDTVPPADFTPEVVPGARTVRRNPIVNFQTTDRDSGLNHYEAKLIPISHPENLTPLFAEVASPLVPSLDFGKYDLIIRAYDQAGNYREKTVRIEVVSTLFELVGLSGFRISAGVTIPWALIIGLMLLSFLIAAYAVWRSWHWHTHFKVKFDAGAINDPIIRARLEELRAKQQEYKKALIILLIIGWTFGLTFMHVAKAADPAEPPVVTTFSSNISNTELFYLGGSVRLPADRVEIYLQDRNTGATLKLSTPVDNKGNWFYSHNTFLSPSDYLVWVQSEHGDVTSPPSSQASLHVERAAIQFGASRISLEALYLTFVLLFLFLDLSAAGVVIYFVRKGRRYRRLRERAILEAEHALRTGFALLKKDIEAELELLHGLKLDGEFKSKEKERELKLLKDLDIVARRVGKEIFDIETTR